MPICVILPETDGHMKFLDPFLLLLGWKILRKRVHKALQTPKLPTFCFWRFLRNRRINPIVCMCVDFKQCNGCCELLQLLKYLFYLLVLPNLIETKENKQVKKRPHIWKFCSSHFRELWSRNEILGCWETTYIAHLCFYSTIIFRICLFTRRR